jgi:hypothetical protein
MTYLGKTVSTKAGNRHEIDIWNRIASFLQVRHETVKGSCLQLGHNLWRKVGFHITCAATRTVVVHVFVIQCAVCSSLMQHLLYHQFCQLMLMMVRDVWNVEWRVRRGAPARGLV